MRIIETDKQEQYRTSYLPSNHWQSIRAQKLLETPFCKYCGKKTFLHVHHLSYANRGREELSDLVVLCRIHHLELHKGIISLTPPQKKKVKTHRKTSITTFLQTYHKNPENIVAITTAYKKLDSDRFTENDKIQLHAIMNKLNLTLG